MGGMSGIGKVDMIFWPELLLHFLVCFKKFFLKSKRGFPRHNLWFLVGEAEAVQEFGDSDECIFLSVCFEHIFPYLGSCGKCIGYEMFFKGEKLSIGEM